MDRVKEAVKHGDRHMSLAPFTGLLVCSISMVFFVAEMAGGIDCDFHYGMPAGGSIRVQNSFPYRKINGLREVATCRTSIHCIGTEFIHERNCNLACGKPDKAIK